ncbi:MAG: thiamine pyrophosphate-dependent enzyme [Pseudomonadota bacterium]
MPSTSPQDLAARRLGRALAIAAAGSIEAAVERGTLTRRLDLRTVEALVLGLLLQEVRCFLTVLGHGSTELGEVLRVYEQAGLVRTVPCRSEIEASHAASALRWVTGEKAAVVTSIGPGALQALAASLVPASDGLGVWYLLGDETTEDEGPNMQQVPRHEQGLFHRMFSAMGATYTLHTPWALPTALKRGRLAVDHPHRAGPFFLLLPMNTQPAVLEGFHLRELRAEAPPALGAAADPRALREAVAALRAHRQVVVRVGGGARGAGPELERFLDLCDGVAVTSPLVSGVLPYEHPRNMLVGGSKGSICGNFAMEHADLLVAVGTRAVCQSDSSRTGYPEVRRVIDIDTDPGAATHYGDCIPLLGEARATLRALNGLLEQQGAERGADPSPWLAQCREQRQAWETFKLDRYRTPTLHDELWGREVLTQPAAIKLATDWARQKGAVCFFDAGDVQANGFQVVECDRPGRVFTETGASYMGWAASALLAGALSRKPFYGLALSGDGSFFMSPQVLIDAVAQGARGCVLLMDNRRMAAISGLQKAQYGAEHATWDHVSVDYVRLAGAVEGVLALHGGFSTAHLHAALDQAWAHPGLSLIHLPVYHGDDPLGGLGAFGRWNVGNWVADTQRLRHDIGL